MAPPGLPEREVIHSQPLKQKVNEIVLLLNKKHRVEMCNATEAQ
jgi:hypothetical protein